LPWIRSWRDGLVHARRRRARHRRPLPAGGLALTGLLATAGAPAATGVLRTGDPVEPRRVERDADHGVGAPVGTTARLLDLRAPGVLGRITRRLR